MRRTYILGTALLSAGLLGCSSEPIASITSLSPIIRTDTVSDGSALADASDQILLMNILRARDRKPLDMSALSSISSTLSLQGSAGFTVPFGPRPANPTGDTWSPSVTGSTTPTFTFTPLNTQGFTTTFVQPVTANYIASRWNAGVSPELLMLLFIKQISLPSRAIEHADPQTPPVQFETFVNNPDNEGQFQAFLALVGVLLQHDASLKVFDLLDPVGPEFDFLSNNFKSSGDVVRGQKLQPRQANSSVYTLVTSTNDAAYHVGNGTGATHEATGRLYRAYSGQVAMCVDRDGLDKLGLFIPDLGKFVPTKNATAKTRAQAAGGIMRSQLALALPSVSTSTTKATAQPGGAQPQTAAAGPTQNTTAALQAGRYSAIVDESGCSYSEVVLDKTAEDDFPEQSNGFVRIEWRSTAEVIEYLGAILRRNRTKLGLVHWSEFPNPRILTANNWTIDQGEYNKAKLPAGATVDIALKNCAVLRTELANGKIEPVIAHSQCKGFVDHATPGTPLGYPSMDLDTHILFDVDKDSNGRVQVMYDGNFYVVPDDVEKHGGETMATLGMLSTLVNLANGSTASATQPLQLIPIP